MSLSARIWASRTSSSLLVPFLSPGGEDGSKSKRIWRGRSREFDFGGQLCLTETTTHLDKKRFPRIWKARSGKHGYIGLLDASSLKSCPLPPAWSLRMEIAKIFFVIGGFFWGFGCIQSGPSSTILPPWVALQELKFQTTSFLGRDILQYDLIYLLGIMDSQCSHYASHWPFNNETL